MAKISQLKKIKKHLEDGASITPLEALNLYGCFRLSAVIFNIKELGLDISTTMVKNGDTRYASYKLESEAVA